jgi:UDP-N-acetylmuramoyl-L-alanyl-D-glutamate--2,6-diaminopimelate ligase
MTLGQVLGPAAGPAAALEVTALAYDHRQVGPGTLFFCVPGHTRDGHDFASDAVASGAVALVVERELGLGVPEIVVPSARAAMAPAAAAFFGDPSANLDVLGVTGTNGKTTTAFLIRHLLEAAGRQTALLGTVKAVVGGQESDVERTTPEAIDLQATLRAMVDAGDVACAMEVSSHALDLGRVDAIRFAAGVFTNLTQDHLDFHGSMEDYFAAKRRLFERDPGVAVVNADDEYGRRLAADFSDAVTFGIDSEADFRARDLALGAAGAHFVIDTPAGEIAVESPLPGRFNVSNVLGALAAVHGIGLDLREAAAALPGAARVPGRFEPVDEGQQFAVLVDYAHTPDSLDNVLRAARGIADERVICVFGCGGDRDRGKRPEMGRIARALADVVVVTSDNPRSEDPEAIIREILAGSGSDVDWLVDRRAAIGRAIEQARPGDVVVIAGKGHEQGQEFAGGRKVPFDDVTVARETLRGVRATSTPRS